MVQLAQALGSFLVQIVVARRLGLDGLAVFAVLYGLILLGAGVTTGLVGDSLTVLDRSIPAVRASLQQLTLVATLVMSAIGAVIAPMLNASIDATATAWFALAAVLFMLEEVGRRLLMALLHFWTVVLADLVGLTVTLASLGLWARRGDVSLAVCFAAIAVGQAAALVVIVVLLPRSERWLAAPSTERLREVWSYGRWRAVQQLFRPATLTGVRVVSIGAAGAATYGRLEAARILIAPAIHVVAGISNRLFAGFALDRRSSDRELVVATDRPVVPLILVVGVVGALAVGGASLWGPAVTGSGIDLGTTGLFSWTAYAAATAVSAPYLALAAARGRQRRLTAIRLTEAVGSVAIVAMLAATGTSIFVLPAVLAVVTVLAAVMVRASLVPPHR